MGTRWAHCSGSSDKCELFSFIMELFCKKMWASIKLGNVCLYVCLSIYFLRDGRGHAPETWWVDVTKCIPFIHEITQPYSHPFSKDYKSVW